MSEAERKRRLDYRRFRKKWVSIQATVLAIVLILCAISGVIYFRNSRTHYVHYNEHSEVDYGVYYKGSQLFLDGAYHGKNYAYIAQDIERFVSEFEYELKFDTAGKVDFKYTYRIDAKVVITDKSSGKPVYDKTETVVDAKTFERRGNALLINERVELDYQKYNQIADAFSGYGSLESALLVELHVNVLSASDEFSENNQNAFVTALSVPLCKQVIDTKLTSSIPQGESKLLAYSDAEYAHTWRVLLLVLACIAAVLIVEFILFISLTRNTDITYDIRLGRLVKSYKSFIQKITNVFDDTGYQLLFVSSFTEMLEIRDTIQSPILMNENLDRTCTRFLIPTNTKLLYVYELKVDDYDEIYASAPIDEEPTVELTEPAVEPAPAAVEAIAVVEEAPIEEEAPAIEEEAPAVEEEAPAVEEEAPAVEEELPAIEEAPAVEEAPIPEATEKAKTVVKVVVKTATKPSEEPIATPSEDATDEDADEGASAIYSRVRRSFQSKLIQSTEDVKSYYSEIKNELLSYRKVKSRISWNCDTFNQGRARLAKINVRGKTLCLYLALSPEAYTESKYFFTDMSQKSQYEATPMMLKIKSARGVKHAKELIADLAGKLELVKNPSYEAQDLAPAYEDTATLIEKGLIRDPFGDVTGDTPETE